MAKTHTLTSILPQTKRSEIMSPRDRPGENNAGIFIHSLIPPARFSELQQRQRQMSVAVLLALIFGAGTDKPREQVAREVSCMVTHAIW